jgi:hypothetical protein
MRKHFKNDIVCIFLGDTLVTNMLQTWQPSHKAQPCGSEGNCAIPAAARWIK